MQPRQQGRQGRQPSQLGRAAALHFAHAVGRKQLAQLGLTQLLHACALQGCWGGAAAAQCGRCVEQVHAAPHAPLTAAFFVAQGSVVLCHAPPHVDLQGKMWRFCPSLLAAGHVAWPQRGDQSERCPGQRQHGGHPLIEAEGLAWWLRPLQPGCPLLRRPWCFPRAALPSMRRRSRPSQRQQWRSH
jgi:hypothetical protein